MELLRGGALLEDDDCPTGRILHRISIVPTPPCRGQTQMRQFGRDPLPDLQAIALSPVANGRGQRAGTLLLLAS
jgi:hypothetical protein